MKRINRSYNTKASPTLSNINQSLANTGAATLHYEHKSIRDSVKPSNSFKIMFLNIDLLFLLVKKENSYTCLFKLSVIF